MCRTRISKRTPNRGNEDWLQSCELANDQLEKDHDRKSARCPNRPPAGGVGLCRHDSRHGAARRQPSAAGPEREPQGGSGQHDQYDRRGRSGFELRDGGREGRIRIAQGQHQARPLQGGGEPHRLRNADRDGRDRLCLRQEGRVQVAQDRGGQAEIRQRLGHRRGQDHQPRRGQYPAARDVSGRYPPPRRPQNVTTEGITMVTTHARFLPVLLATALLGACGQRLDIEVKARIDGQPAAQAKVAIDREEVGVTDAQGAFAQRLSRKAGSEVEVTVSKEAPGYRIDPWKATFLVKLPKGDEIVTYRVEADLKATRYVTVRVSEAGAPVPEAKVTIGCNEAAAT